ncbi:MAG: hypothetical protein WBB45_09555 [Cyclobacteriaceae bacterium]
MVTVSQMMGAMQWVSIAWRPRYSPSSKPGISTYRNTSYAEETQYHSFISTRQSWLLACLCVRDRAIVGARGGGAGAGDWRKPDAAGSLSEWPGHAQLPE